MTAIRGFLPTETAAGAGVRVPLRLCPPCSERRCEQRGPECGDTSVCQCPCALADSPDEVASFARQLRSVPWPNDIGAGA